MTYDPKRNRLVIPMNDWNARHVRRAGRVGSSLRIREIAGPPRLRRSEPVASIIAPVTRIRRVELRGTLFPPARPGNSSSRPSLQN